MPRDRHEINKHLWFFGTILLRNRGELATLAFSIIYCTANYFISQIHQYLSRASKTKRIYTAVIKTTSLSKNTMTILQQVFHFRQWLLLFLSKLNFMPESAINY